MLLLLEASNTHRTVFPAALGSSLLRSPPNENVMHFSQPSLRPATDIMTSQANVYPKTARSHLVPLINVGVIASLAIVLAARMSAKEFAMRSLAWDDCELVIITLIFRFGAVW